MSKFYTQILSTELERSFYIYDRQTADCHKRDR